MKILKNNKGKREFSKCWLFTCGTISLLFSIASMVLSAFDKNPVSELSIAIVDAVWGTSGVSFIGYILQNSVRAYTASKFGIPKEEGEDDGHTDDSGNSPDTGADDISDSEPEVQGTRMAQVRCVKSRKGTR